MYNGVDDPDKSIRYSKVNKSATLEVNGISQTYYINDDGTVETRYYIGEGRSWYADEVGFVNSDNKIMIDNLTFSQHFNYGHQFFNDYGALKPDAKFEYNYVNNLLNVVNRKEIDVMSNLGNITKEDYAIIAQEMKRLGYDDCLSGEIMVGLNIKFYIAPEISGIVTTGELIQESVASIDTTTALTSVTGLRSAKMNARYANNDASVIARNRSIRNGNMPFDVIAPIKTTGMKLKTGFKNVKNAFGNVTYGMKNMLSNNFGSVGPQKKLFKKRYFNNVSSNTVVDNKAWKEKVVLPSKPHTNKTPGHWFASLRKAVGQAKDSVVEKVFLNKSLSKAKPGANRNRPDVTVKKINGMIDQYEVPSKTDDINKLIERMEMNQESLGDSAGDIYILPIK